MEARQCQVGRDQGHPDRICRHPERGEQQFERRIDDNEESRPVGEQLRDVTVSRASSMQLHVRLQK
jgi:hypothetical protein